MSTRIGGVTSAGGRRAGRTATALAAAVLVTGGAGACTGDPGRPEVGGITAEELQQVEDELAGLDDRVAALEDGPAPGSDTAEIEETETAETGTAETGTEAAGTDAGTAAFLRDSRSYAGTELTVRAEISEVVTTTGIGSAFRIAGGSGSPVAVVTASQPVELDADDAVRVSGTVVEVQRDTFEQDFGIAAGELFADPSAWFAEEGGSVAISADRVEVLPEQERSE